MAYCTPFEERTLFKLTCEICNSDFINASLRPVYLQCGHTFCASCGKKLHDDKSYCPKCGKSVAKNPSGVLPENLPFLRVCSALQSTKTFTSHYIASVQKLIVKLDTCLDSVTEDENNTIQGILNELKEEYRRVEMVTGASNTPSEPNFLEVAKISPNYINKIITALQYGKNVYYHSSLNGRHKYGRLSIENNMILFHSQSYSAVPQDQDFSVLAKDIFDNFKSTTNFGVFLKLCCNEKGVIRTMVMELIHQEWIEQFLLRCLGIYSGQNYKGQYFGIGICTQDAFGVIAVEMPKPSSENESDGNFHLFASLARFVDMGDIIVEVDDFGDFRVLQVKRHSETTKMVARVKNPINLMECISYTNESSLKIVDCGWLYHFDR